MGGVRIEYIRRLVKTNQCAGCICSIAAQGDGQASASPCLERESAKGAKRTWALSSCAHLLAVAVFLQPGTCIGSTRAALVRAAVPGVAVATARGQPHQTS